MSWQSPSSHPVAAGGSSSANSASGAVRPAWLLAFSASELVRENKQRAFSWLISYKYLYTVNIDHRVFACFPSQLRLGNVCGCTCISGKAEARCFLFFADLDVLGGFWKA